MADEPYNSRQILNSGVSKHNNSALPPQALALWGTETLVLSFSIFSMMTGCWNYAACYVALCCVFSYWPAECREQHLSIHDGSKEQQYEASKLHPGSR